MSYYDYKAGQELAQKDAPFYALIMAAMMRADSSNIVRLMSAFPQVYDELQARYNAPGGLLEADR